MMATEVRGGGPKLAEVALGTGSGCAIAHVEVDRCVV